MLTWSDTFSEQIHSRQSAWLAALVAAGLLSWAVTDAAVRLRAGPFAPADRAVNPAKTAVRVPPVQYSAQDIINAHLFGTAAPMSKPDQPTANAPETQLRLTLRGVAAATNPRYSRAIIAVADTTAKPYAIGQLVESSDARIRAVNPKYVLLDRNGAVERLSLIEPPLTGKTDKKSASTSDILKSSISKTLPAPHVRQTPSKPQIPVKAKDLTEEQRKQLNQIFNPFKGSIPSG